MRSLMKAVPSSVFRITTENQREYKCVIHIVNGQVKSGLDAIKKAQMVC